MITLDELANTIGLRRTASPESSWTARLLSEGRERCAKKFGEEAMEVVIAGVKGDRGSLKAEAADALYHLLILLEASGVSLEEVMNELESRKGKSGIDEKRSRSA